MPRYLLNKWEENFYHDSYFYAVVWDPDNHEAQSLMTGATAFAGGNTEKFEKPTPEIAEAARQWLEPRIFEMLRTAEHADVLEPNTIKKDQRVRLLTAHKNQVKDPDPDRTFTCTRCGGTGKWVNPHDSADERNCFGCRGTGAEVRAWLKRRDAQGKIVWAQFAAGLAGRVVWHGTYRTIWRKGYNRYDRSTITCRVLLDDGRKLSVPLAKLRLDREPMSDDELRRRAHDLSYEMNFKPLFSKHGGWLSSNPAWMFVRKPEQRKEAA